MNQIERIFDLPGWDWLDHSKMEMSINTTDVVGMTDFIWRVGKSAVVGFIYQSFLSPPWMWFLLSDQITIGDLMDYRRLKNLIPRGTLTGVQQGYDLGVRFATLYG